MSCSKVFEAVQKRANTSEATAARLAARLAEVSPYDVAELDRALVLRTPVNPLYPPELKKAGVEGEVVADFVVDTDGAVQDVRIIKSTAKEFDVAAVEALQQWKFSPGEKGGVAVNTRVKQLLRFEPN